VAAIYNMVVGVEKEHNIIFKYLHEAFKTNTLYKSEKPTLWICSECGYLLFIAFALDCCPDVAFALDCSEADFALPRLR